MSISDLAIRRLGLQRDQVARFLGIQQWQLNLIDSGWAQLRGESIRNVCARLPDLRMQEVQRALAAAAETKAQRLADDPRHKPGDLASFEAVANGGYLQFHANPRSYFYGTPFPANVSNPLRLLEEAIADSILRPRNLDFGLPSASGNDRFRVDGYIFDIAAPQTVEGQAGA